MANGNGNGNGGRRRSAANGNAQQPKPKEEKPNVIDERIREKRDVTQSVMGNVHTRRLLKQVDI